MFRTQDDDYEDSGDQHASLDMFGRPVHQATALFTAATTYQTEDHPTLDIFGRPIHDAPARFGAATAHQVRDHPTLDMFGRPIHDGSAEAVAHRDALHAVTEPPDDDGIELFTVTNPDWTVTVSARVGGAIHRVRLSASVVGMTEAQLCDEIMVLARLAVLKARAAERTLMEQSLSEAAGYDAGRRAALHELVSRAMALPTPQEAAATQEEVFAARYAVR